MLYKQISQNKRNTVIIMVLFGILMLAISALFANFLTIWAGVISLLLQLDMSFIHISMQLST